MTTREPLQIIDQGAAPPPESFADKAERIGGAVGQLVGAGLAWLACYYWLKPLIWSIPLPF